MLGILLERVAWLRGWGVAAILAGVYLLVEVMAFVISGDLGSMLFVTWHFVVAPLLAAVIMILTLLAAFRTEGASRRVVMISSVAVEVFIILIAFTGDPGLLRIFGFR